MGESERKRAAVRYDCLKWAMQNGARGERVEATLARAQLYADFVLTEGATGLSDVVDKMRVDRV